MKAIRTLVLLIGMATAAFAQDADFKAVIPTGVEIQPLIREADIPPALRSAEAFLLSAPAGQPFLALGNRLLNLTATNAADAVFPIGGDTKLDSIAWMPDGTLMAVSGRNLGIVTSTGLAVRCELPDSGMKIEPASAEEVYAFGGSADGARGDVYLYRNDGRVLHLLKTAMPVTAVAGTGQSTFVACGDTIYVMVMGGKLSRVDVVSGEVVSLAIVPPFGLFYSTRNTVGYLHDRDSGACLFMNGSGGTLRAGDGALYLMTPGEGVYRFSNLEGFERILQILATAEAVVAP